MKRWTTVKKLIFLLICLIMVVPIACYSLRSFIQYGFNIRTTADTEWDDLTSSQDGPYELIDYIIKRTPEDSVFLVFRQNEFAYYAQRKFIRHLDPRLVEIYKLDDKDKVYNALLELGIDYIYTPPYMLPTQFKSQVYRIAADPCLSELVKDSSGYRLYKLCKEPREIKLEPLNIKNANFSNFNCGEVTPSDWSLHSFDNWSYLVDKDRQPALFAKNINKKKQVLIYSGQGHLSLPPSNCFSKASIEPETVYHFKTTVRGEGEFRIYLAEFSQDGSYVWTPLWKSVLTDSYAVVENQFMTSSDACEYRIAFATGWKGELFLRDISIEKVAPLNKIDVVTEPNIDPKEKRWVPLQSYDFEDVKPNSPQSIDWHLWASENPIALSPDSHSGKHALRLTQSGWLHNSPEDPDLYLSLISRLKPYLYQCQFSESLRPSIGRLLLAITDNAEKIDDSQALDHRLMVFVKGKGVFDLFVWYELENKKKCLYFGRYYLPNNYERLNKVFKLPQKAENIRIAFKLKDSNKFQALYIDDLVIEREKVQPFNVDQKNGVSN